MKVSKLIEELQGLDQDLEVICQNEPQEKNSFRQIGSFWTGYFMPSRFGKGRVSPERFPWSRRMVILVLKD